MEMAKLIGLLYLLFGPSIVLGQQVFFSLDSLLVYATGKNKSIQSGTLRFDQAKQAKLAAIAGIPDLSGGASFTYTNNTRLPVNLFPAEIFGGEKGTFREVQSGIQYVSNGNVYVDLKLFNLAAWENLRLSKLNIEATQSDNRITLKNLQNNIAANYFNIVNLQEQLKAMRQNAMIADTLLRIATHKYQQGLGKPQDVNEAQSNHLNSRETARQLEFLITQQYNYLKILCDIPDQDSILIGQFIDNVETPRIPQVVPNRLEVFNGLMKEKMAWSSYRQARFALLPTVSLFWSNTSQQFNTRSTLFDQDVRWIPSSFLGVKLNWNIPSSQAIAQISKTRNDYALSKLNTEHLQSKMEIEAKQLVNDYHKAASQAQTNREVFRLKRDTYTKNLSLYNAGLIGLDQVMNNYNALVNSHYNLISASISVLLAEANIALNNNPK